jgi:hypothetical protein
MATNPLATLKAPEVEELLTLAQHYLIESRSSKTTNKEKIENDVKVRTIIIALGIITHIPQIEIFRIVRDRADKKIWENNR